MRRLFTHRYRSRGDRSGGAHQAEARGLEASVDAARRLRVPHRFLRDASEEFGNAPTERHHVSIRSEPAALLDYRSPDEWDRIARFAAKLVQQARSGKVTFDRFVQLARHRGLVVSRPYPSASIAHAVDSDGVVRARFTGQKIGRVEWTR